MMMEKARLESSLRNMPFNRRFSRFAILCFFVLAAGELWRKHTRQVHNFYPSSTKSYFDPINVPDADTRTTAELCATFPKRFVELVQPVLRMRHGEDRKKVEAQLNSVCACFDHDDLLIYSDLEEEIRGHHVVDVLADLPPSYQVDNPEFDNYVWQKEMRANGTLDVDQSATARLNTLVLDKYKFLPMVEKAWTSKPGRAYYFFLDTDTYVFWDNVFRFLLSFDPDQLHYMGSPSPGRHDDAANKKTFFANGGPGFILSRGAMKRLMGLDANSGLRASLPILTEAWLPLLKEECCGDSVLGWMLWHHDIPVQGYWPMFNPHPVNGIPFSDDYWCQPILTLHETKPIDMRKLWKWEYSHRQAERPILYSDLWSFQHPSQPSIIRPWDNGDWDGWVAPPELGINTFERCGDYCLEHEECKQWNFRGGDENKCVAMRSIRYGAPRSGRDEDNGIEVSSGWVEPRVAAFRRERQCLGPDWVGPSTKRIF